MSVEQQKQVREIFEKLILKDSYEWPALLDELCRSDRELRSEVELLLKKASSEESYLETVRQNVIEPSLKCLGEDPTKLNVWLEYNPGDDDDSNSLVGQTVSHFQILEVLGSGGMGRVFLARDLNLDRIVVLKFLPPYLNSDRAFKERFTFEAKTASALEHPNIATIYEIDETSDHQLFIAMGYYKGKSLGDKIDAGSLNKETVLDYAIQLTGALVKAHENGVVHKDIKPGNVIVGEDGRLRLIDFGLAEMSGTAGVAQGGQFSGTVAYMSPEQVNGKRVDNRTDIWSLGVVLFEMLYGFRPFKGDSIPVVFRSILNGDPWKDRSAFEQTGAEPDSLEAVVRTCLEKDPNRRYSTASDLLEDLRYLQEEKNPPVGRTKPHQRPWWIRLLVPAFALLGIMTVTIYLVQDKDRKEPLPIPVSVAGVTFTQITEGTIVGETGGFGGLSWGDYNDDGWMDLVVCGLTPKLFKNLGNGKFSQENESAIVRTLTSGERSPFSASWADFENDGDLDLFVTELQGLYVPDNQSYVDDTKDLLFLNNGDGSFSKDDADWLLAGPSANASWGDLDNDGLLDLFVTRFEEEDLVFHHQPDGSMLPKQISVPGKSFGTTLSDIDSDGDLDIIIANRPNMLFRNEGGMEFTEMTSEHQPDALFSETWSFAVSTGDYDNDGDLDLAVTDHSFDRIFRNDQENGWSMLEIGPSSLGSCAWGDFDNDGFLDLLISHGRRLYHNQRDGTFSRVTVDSIVEDSSENKSCTWIDFDNDGDLDIVFGDGILWGGKLIDPPKTLAVYRNDRGTNNWISFKLIGTRSNRTAIGAKVYLTTTIRDKKVQQLREISGGNGLGCQNDMRVHFGLGNATDVEHVRIEWPSGQTDVFRDLAPNQFLRVEEGDSVR